MSGGRREEIDVSLKATYLPGDKRYLPMDKRVSVTTANERFSKTLEPAGLNGRDEM